MSGPVDVLRALDREIERAGGDEYIDGRALIEVRDAVFALIEAADHARIEWRLHGSLTDSCRVLERAIERVGGAA